MNQFKILPTYIKITFPVLVVITIVSVVLAINFYSKLSLLENPSAATESEIKATVAQVGKFLVLPTNETPTLATVSDPAKLKDQPFFANAATGDKVLIYTNSRKAVLWRPSVSKIIEVSALNVPSTPVPITPATK
jgi:hypothetical protein